MIDRLFFKKKIAPSGLSLPEGSGVDKGKLPLFSNRCQSLSTNWTKGFYLSVKLNSSGSILVR